MGGLDTEGESYSRRIGEEYAVKKRGRCLMNGHVQPADAVFIRTRWMDTCYSNIITAEW